MVQPRWLNRSETHWRIWVGSRMMHVKVKLYRSIWSSAHDSTITVSATKYSYLMCPKPWVNQYQVLISKLAHASLITCATWNFPSPKSSVYQSGECLDERIFTHLILLCTFISPIASIFRCIMPSARKSSSYLP